MNVSVDMVALDNLSKTGVSAAHIIQHHLAHMARVAAGLCECELGKLGATSMHDHEDGTLLIVSEVTDGHYLITGHRPGTGAASQHRPRAPHPN